MKTVRQQVGMALIIGAVIGVALAMLGLALVNPPSASAACPAAEELFCPPLWTPKLQAQKVREETLDRVIANARPGLNLNGCDDACAAKYDEDRGGVLTKMATLNNLPKTKVIKAYIAYWDSRAVAADNLGKPWNMQDVAATWMNDFAQKVNVNPPYRVFAGRGTEYCLLPDYGGSCPGLW